MALLLLACSSTTDTIGSDQGVSSLSGAAGAAGLSGYGGAGGVLGSAGTGGVAPQPPTLMQLSGPDSYPNPLHDELLIASDDVNSRVEDTFDQLFHGDANKEAIYFTSATNTDDSITLADDEAIVKDVYHDNVRTEGMGLGMLICVELGKSDEFDMLWNYAKRVLRFQTGSPNVGYFRSFCDATMTSGSGGSTPCVDPYGAEMFVMSLIFAHDRGFPNADEYGADALDVLNVMLHWEDINGGISDAGTTDTFDSETKLAFDIPNVSAASLTRPSVLMPAFYTLWAQATGNPFFKTAATSARGFFQKAADENTGLIPLRAYFDGTPVPGSDTFTPEAYRVLPNIVLDELWTTDTENSTAAIKEINRVLGFFASQGISSYGTDYQLDGTIVSGQTMHEPALVFTNGMTAMLSTIDAQDRQAFMQDVWNMKTPTGSARYFQGIMQLFALLVLSGQMQVY